MKKMSCCACLWLAGWAGWAAPGYERYAVAREAVFEFAAPPQAKRAGDTVTVSFETKGFCDATVAVEDAAGRIVRHLASGVLGPNAPEPFQKNSRRQTLVWDGKDDQGVYVDDKDSLVVRVSLGLKPQFERTLFWSPYKRFDTYAPIIRPSPEGVFVYQAHAIDMVSLYNRKGEYLRTVYPFPADKANRVVALPTHVFPQDGLSLPLKQGYHRSTLLPGQVEEGAEHFVGGRTAKAMAVHPDGRIALARHFLHRLHADGTSGNLPLPGPETLVSVDGRPRPVNFFPRAAAFSPDGRWLYLTAYKRQHGWAQSNCESLHGVLRLDYEKGGKPDVFVGHMTMTDFGDGPDRLCIPNDVATDAKGRVYVADYMNDRVQIFSPDGKLLRSLAVPNPARVQVLAPTQGIAVFSFPELGAGHRVIGWNNSRIPPDKQPPPSNTLTLFGSFEEPGAGKVVPLPFKMPAPSLATLRLILDPWAEPLSLWVAGHTPLPHEAFDAGFARARERGRMQDTWEDRGIRIYALTNGNWSLQKDFAAVAKEAVSSLRPSDFGRQRLYFNPKNENLYVAKDDGLSKTFRSLEEINPATGRVRTVRLPFAAEDVCFDREGHIYLRDVQKIVRYDPDTWREIPWDYGEEIGAGKGRILSAITPPGTLPFWYHLTGMGINAKGDLAFGIHTYEKPIPRRSDDPFADARGYFKPYTPSFYPGRPAVSLWVYFVADRHGKIRRDDALPGLTQTHQIQIDDDQNLYALVQGRRVYEGKPYFELTSGTLIKYGTQGNKTVASGSAPVPLPELPARDADMERYHYGNIWTEGAEWMYGGVGYVGPALQCTCWNSRFELDFFRRSFVPETLRFRVAVLDAAGNLILRIGSYGNADDGLPLVGNDALDPRSPPGPPRPHSIGGDEVALFHAAYLATHTDRRLFIHDYGNQRILSVKLNYHADKTVALKDVPDRPIKGTVQN